MPLLPMGSFDLMQRELIALHQGLETLKDKIPEDDFQKINGHIEKIKKEIQAARF